MRGFGRGFIAVALVVSAGGLVASSAQAVTLVWANGSVAQPYQRWVDSTNTVPLPHGIVALHHAPCPTTATGPHQADHPAWEGEVVACTTTTNGTPAIYMHLDAWQMPDNWTDRKPTFFHELGHVYERQALVSGWPRDRLAALFSFLPGWDVTDPRLFREWIADGYALCAARGGWLPLVDLDETGRLAEDSGYGYLPSPRAHRRVCAAIRASASADPARSYSQYARLAQRCEGLRRARKRPAWQRRGACLRRLEAASL